MFSPKILLLSASLFSYALAQVKIAFISVPAVVVAGESYNITWGGGDGTPVTITLREGDPSLALKTIATLADSVSETSFTWSVSKTLATASDYELQITQGQNSINYSGSFSVAGGTGTSVISYSGISTTTSASNGTVTPPGPTSTAIASAGFSTIIASNGTFSPATLSATSTSLSAASTQHMTSIATQTSTNFNFGSVPSSTSSAPTASASTSAPNSANAQLGSSAAMVMGVFAAVMFLS